MHISQSGRITGKGVYQFALWPVGNINLMLFFFFVKLVSSNYVELFHSAASSSIHYNCAPIYRPVMNI